MVVVRKPYRSIEVDNNLIITEGMTVKFTSINGTEVTGLVVGIGGKKFVIHVNGDECSSNWEYVSIQHDTISIVE